MHTSQYSPHEPGGKQPGTFSHNSSHHELENELANLRKQIENLKRLSKFDEISGLPNRAHFLERAAAEFSRTGRYSHDLSMVLIWLDDKHRHDEQTTDKQMVTGLSQICESVSRNGIDIMGRISETKFAVLLPETGLAGAIQFDDRLRKKIGGTPIFAGQSSQLASVVTAIDTVQMDDTSIMDAFGRCHDAINAA